MKPQQVPALGSHFVEDIAVGVDHTLALMSSGDVWAWGNNSDGQLGLGHISSPVKEPQPIPGLDGIRQVCILSTEHTKYPTEHFLHSLSI